MRRRMFYAFVASILLILFMTNQYIEIEYDINIFQYFKKSDALNEEEKVWLKDHGKLIFGSDQSSPPLRYIDERNGQYKGLIIDYIRVLSVELKHEIAFEPVVLWNDTFDSLKSNQKDFFDMISSAERSEQFDFTDSIYTLQGVILKANKNADIKMYQDLKDETVAVPAGDYAIEFLQKRLPQIDIIQTNDMERAMLLLKSGEVDAVVGDEPVIVYLLNPLNMKEDFDTTAPIYKEPASFAVRKSDKILIDILNKGIFSLKKKKVMSDLQQKWFGITEDFSNVNSSGKNILISFGFISIIGIMIYVAYSWNMTLKNEVDKRTHELYLSRQKLKVTLDGLTNPMVVLDKNRRIVNVNKVFCKFVTCEGRKPLGIVFSGLHAFFAEEAVLLLVQRAFNETDKQREEIHYENKIYVVSAFPITDMDGELNVLVMFEDITRIKVAEQRMLQNSKMNSVGVLAAGVAHEIRNPLGLIGHYSYILRTNKGNDLERQDKALTVIENSVERASNIIDNLLNFSRITSDEIRTRNIKEFITNILALESEAMKRKSVSYKLECDEDLVCGVRPEPLKHMLINLIANAIDAMSTNGELKIYCILEDSKLILKITDNGIGIAPERLEEIFTPFYTTKQTSQGTGLGLYIVYNEVTKYGGTIKVDSELNKGTTFTLVLPNQEGAM